MQKYDFTWSIKAPQDQRRRECSFNQSRYTHIATSKSTKIHPVHPPHTDHHQQNASQTIISYHQAKIISNQTVKYKATPLSSHPPGTSSNHINRSHIDIDRHRTCGTTYSDSPSMPAFLLFFFGCGAPSFLQCTMRRDHDSSLSHSKPARTGFSSSSSAYGAMWSAYVISLRYEEQWCACVRVCVSLV